jgi:serine/threonine protein kinase/tetratricopeptide (TPR) repeat protein
VDRAKLELDDVFCAALELASPAERAAYLDHACGDDRDARRRVERLLAAHSQAGNFLGAGPAVIAATTDLPAPAIGTMIGPYKLLQQIGEGGMGTVFMAEQQHPVQRKAALKVIKPGMDSRQVIARFEAERQALALMDHVNIARVLDAGSTESGRPYFVMELVHGVPITTYCDDNRLTPRERLDLFVPVCQAIQHAHQKGIIHRDLKPSNVLVTLYDGKPVPKVIDFGVAKAIEQRLTERTLFTQYGTMVGTLEYMSPEQAEMSALGVDTRSDIYALGVLLYELLTGNTPLTHQRLKEAAYVEILRIIKEEEPPRPSTRLSDSGEALASISAQRHMEPAKLTKLVRGELDWIVMKTLEKDRNRRYETANGFALDVQRTLNDEPVQACPSSAWYRFRKFTRRHKTVLVTAGVVALVVLLGVGSVGWIVRDRATQRTKTANEVEEALRNAEALYGRGQLPEANSSAQRAQALLATGRGSEELKQRVAEWLADLDLVGTLDEIRQLWPDRGQRETHAAYAKAFHDFGIDVKNLAAPEAAAAIAARPIQSDLLVALDMWALKEPPDSAVRRHLLEIIGALDQDRWRIQVREAVVRRDLRRLRELAAPEETLGESIPTLDLLGSALGGTEDDLGDTEAAVALYRKVRHEHPGEFRFNQALAFYLSKTGPPQWDEAIRYGTVAVASRPGSAAAHCTLGAALLGKGRYAEAIAEGRQAIHLKPDHAPAHNVLGSALASQGLWDEAITSLDEALRLQPDLAPARASLGLAWWRKANAGNWAEAWGKAEAAYREAIRCKPNFAEAHNLLGVLLMNTKRLDEALTQFTEAAQLNPNLPQPRFFLGLTLLRKNQLEESIPAFREALRCDPDSPQFKAGLGEALQKLAWKLLASPNRPESDVRRALELASQAVQLKPRESWAWRTLGVAQYRAGNAAEAILSLRQSIAFLPDRVELQFDSGSTFFLAMAYWQIGNQNEARKWYDHAGEWMEKNNPKDEELHRFRTEAAELLGIEKKKD